MGINIINELRTKPGRSEELIALIRGALPSSLQHGGAEEISIRQDQDDSNYIISVQRWESREASWSQAALRTRHFPFAYSRLRPSFPKNSSKALRTVGQRPSS